MTDMLLPLLNGRRWYIKKPHGRGKTVGCNGANVRGQRAHLALAKPTLCALLNFAECVAHARLNAANPIGREILVGLHIFRIRSQSARDGT